MRLIFDTFLQFELSRFLDIFTMKVNRQWVPCAPNSSNSFIPILLKLIICLDYALKRYACGLDIILRLMLDTFFSIWT